MNLTKSLIFVTFAVSLGVNAYYTRKVVLFAKSSEEYFKYLKLKTDCLEQQNGMDQNDIFLAANGKTREDVTGEMKKYLPVRRMYDIQNEECEAYAKYMCWYLDPKDDEVVDRCGPGFGYSKEEIAEVKRTHSLEVIKRKNEK